MTQSMRKTQRKRTKSRSMNPASKLTPVGRYAQDAYSLGLRTFRGLNEIRKLINIEFKRTDQSNSGGSTSQSGVGTLLTSIAQGTNLGDRVGDSIRTQHIRVCVHALINGAATRSALRVIVVRDHENTGSTPAGSDILTGAGFSTAVVSPMNYFNQSNNGVGRFTLLYDETQTMSITGDQNVLYSYESPLSQHIRYSGSGATSTREGALFVFFFTNESTNTPSVDWYSTVRYTDD